MNFIAIKQQLYATLRENNLSAAIPILETFFNDNVREISYQRLNTEREMLERQRAGVTESMRKHDEMLVLHHVAAAVRSLVTLKHDGLRITGRVLLISDGRDNGHS